MVVVVVVAVAPGREGREGIRSRRCRQGTTAAVRDTVEISSRYISDERKKTTDKLLRSQFHRLPFGVCLP